MDEAGQQTWLLWAGAHGAHHLRREVAARGKEPRFVRVQTEAELVSLAATLPLEDLSVAIDARIADLDMVEGLVRTLRAMSCVHEVFVLVVPGDAGRVARLFCAGATEVITAEAAEASDDAVCEARVENGLIVSYPEVSPARDDAYGGHDIDAALLDAREIRQRVGDAHGTGDLQLHVEDGVGAGEVAAAVDTGEVAVDEEMPPWEEPAGGEQAGMRREVLADEVPSVADATDAGHRAPVIVAISGRGGCGKTTVVASMAAVAARAGLRCAVIDLDLMFGNLADVLGVESPIGLETVGAHARGGTVQERDIEDAAMRVGPGLTLWGPCAEAERAELMASPAEQLIAALRGVADVIFIDTSGQWGDAVAMALGVCDRCLVFGDAGAFSAVSARRAIEVAVRLGVPRARMSSVFNKAALHGEGEEAALRFEMGVSLSSRLRIADGGSEVSGMLSFGHLDQVMSGQGAFAKTVRVATTELLRELGCSLGTLELERETAGRERGHRFRLPWRGAGDER